MEEIITLDGKQFKLTTDVPLTAEQKVQTIAEIRKQTGCGTCGQPSARMGIDWQYGGVKSMAPNTPTCPISTAPGGSAATAKLAGSTVAMVATPVQGVAPYSVEFFMSAANNMTDSVAAATAVHIPGLGEGGDRLGAVNPATGVTEGTPTTRTLTLTTTDLNGATKKGSDLGPTILFGSIITDSCTTPATCANYCKIYVGCVEPICDFTVS